MYGATNARPHLPEGFSCKIFHIFIERVSHFSICGESVKEAWMRRKVLACEQ